MISKKFYKVVRRSINELMQNLNEVDFDGRPLRKMTKRQPSSDNLIKLVVKHNLGNKLAWLTFQS